MKRFLRGSSSRSSKEKQSEEAERPKYNLPRTAEVRPCELPSDDFLRAAGIYDDFYELVENAGLTDFLRDQREQYLLLTNTFVQNFYYYPKEWPPSVEFHLYDVVKSTGLLILLLWGKLGRFPMQELLAYIFLFYITLQYLLVDA